MQHFGIPFWASRGGGFTFTKTQQFQKNNCSGDLTGSFVEFTRTYSGATEEQLSDLIESDSVNFNTQGQANANSKGTCSNIILPKTTRPNVRPRKILAVNASYVWGTLNLQPGETQSGLWRFNRNDISNGLLTTATLEHNSRAEGVIWPYDNNPVNTVYERYGVGQSGGSWRVKVDYYNTSNPNSSSTSMGRTSLAVSSVISDNYTMYPHAQIYGPAFTLRGLHYIHGDSAVYSGVIKYCFSSDSNPTAIKSIVLPSPGTSWVCTPAQVTSTIYHMETGTSYICAASVTWYERFPGGGPNYNKARLRIYQISFSGDTPISVSIVYDDASTNTDFASYAGVMLGSELLCFIWESGNNKVVRIGTGSYANPPSNGWDISHAVSREILGGNYVIYATAGDNIWGAKRGNTLIYEYNGFSNSWSTLYS